MPGMDPAVNKMWEDFINPDILRPRLTKAAIFIAAFDILKNSIVDRLREFFTDVDARHPSAEYEKILRRNRSRLFASLDWLREQNALDDSDLQAYRRVTDCRNTLAHNLFELVSSTGLPPDFDQRFDELVGLLRKIELWWLMGGSPTNADHVMPGPIWGMQLLYDVALGSPERSRFYYEEFRKWLEKPRPVPSPEN